jgi:predicted nucleic acid-binding protein
MRVYADTSFVVKLLTQEPGTATALADYRRLGRPSLFFLPLHGLEVANAIRQRSFHQRQTLPSSERATIKWERDRSFALLQKLLNRGVLVEASRDMEPAIILARTLSERHTEHLGCRGFDLLHVALALELNSDVFLTSDRIQGALASAEGLTVTLSTDAGIPAN